RGRARRRPCRTGPASPASALVGCARDTRRAAPTTVAPSGSAPVTTAGATDPVVLGRGLLPSSTEGAPWQFGPVPIGGRVVDGYASTLTGGGTGALTFAIGGAYRQLTVMIGPAEDPAPTPRAVLFEVIGDGQKNLTAPRTLTSGQREVLLVDVQGVNQLTLRATETGRAAGTDTAVRPAWVAAILK
ncbi:MAG: NPCBM/NEW2 domain-containing protein, partial [Acidimicrobiales bacterium]